MQITVTTSDNVFPVEVPDDIELENFLAICEAQLGISSKDLIAVFNGFQMTDSKKSLNEYGVKNNDVIFIEKEKKPKLSANSNLGGLFGSNIQMPQGLQLPDFGSIKLPGQAGPSTSSLSKPHKEDDAEYIYNLLKSKPSQLQILKQNNPSLAEAFETGSFDKFKNVLDEQKSARDEKEKMRLRLLRADPMDMEAQKLIAQEIENKNIDHNMQLAMEHHPESFATVIMLYIDCKVNGHPIKAFVDSGAQATIMSRAAAEKCGIMRLVDKRFEGIAKGVGEQKIIGRVHMAQIQIKNDFLTSSFSILEDQPMDMLLGLDMLKQHQCCIDLKKNCLLIGTSGTETNFLSESELPECARLSSRRQAASGTSIIKPDDKFTQEVVKELMDYGFPKDQCIAELRANNGDKTKAAAALFEKFSK